MVRTRTFVAVSVSKEVRRGATELVAYLSQADAKVRWVAADNMHVTLKFLGDQPDKRLGEICSAVQLAAQQVEVFPAQFRGAGAFPHVQRPRTIWIGVSAGSDDFRQLFAAVDHQLGQVGIPKERRGFQPHLTIGRVRSAGAGQQLLAELLEERKDAQVGNSTVSEVVVIASTLDRKGPSYDVLARAPLAGA